MDENKNSGGQVKTKQLEQVKNHQIFILDSRRGRFDFSYSLRNFAECVAVYPVGVHHVVYLFCL